MDSLLKERLEKYKEKLLDISGRNRMINTNFSSNSKQYFRFIDELPNELYKQLSEKKMSFKEIPDESELIKDEQTKEFKEEYERQKNINENYLKKIQDIENSESDEINQKIEDVENELKQYVRSILKLPETIHKELTIKEAALKNNINPSYELPQQIKDGAQHRKHKDNYIQTLMFKDELDRHLKGIKRYYKSSIEETGVNPLYICFGFLEWKESNHSDKIFKSPLLMAQAQFEESSNNNKFEISMADLPISINQTLNEKLRQNFGISLPALEIENDNDNDNDDLSIDIEMYLESVKNLIEDRGWKVLRVGTFGVYNAQNMPIFHDINKILNDDIKSDLLERIIVGSNNGLDADSLSVYDVDKIERDKPNLPLLICDADASQHSAVIDSLSGKSFVIKGPPGTGKSQTITNIIAALMHEGKKVLFVAQKQAALDVVRNRLSAVGLKDYILESFSAKLNKKSIIESIKERINKDEPINHNNNLNFKFQKYIEVKKELNEYAEIMRSEFFETKTNIHELIWDINSANDDLDINDLETCINFNVKKITKDDLLQDIESLTYFKNTYLNILEKDRNTKNIIFKIKKLPENPITRRKLAEKIIDFKNKISSYEDIEKKITALFNDINVDKKILSNEITKKIFNDKNSNDIEEFKILKIFVDNNTKELFDICRERRSKYISSNKNLDKYLKNIDDNNVFSKESLKSVSLKKINKTIKVYSESNFFTHILWAIGLKNAVHEYSEAQEFSKKYFNKLNVDFYLGRNLDDVCSKFKDAKVHYQKTLRNVNAQKEAYSNFINSSTSIDPNIESFLELLDDINLYQQYISASKIFNNLGKNSLLKNKESFKVIKEYKSIKDSIESILNLCLKELEITNLKKFTDKVSFIKTLEKSEIELTQLNEFCRDLNDKKNNRIVNFIKNNHLDIKDNIHKIEMCYKNVVRKMQYECLYEKYNNLDKYSKSYIERLRSDLSNLDNDLKNISKDKYANIIHDTGLMAPRGKSKGRVKEKTEMGLLNHISTKSRTKVTLRNMFHNSFCAATSLKPCTMMSPLTVSQLLPLDNESYDTVIIDEASQMKPEYAIGAITRCKQLIIVGDQKQLPPSTEFQSSRDDFDDDEDFDESILDMALTVFNPARELIFHYRSRHQDLIKFSNAKFYKNLLIPTTASLNKKDRGLRHIYLPDACYTTGNSGTGGTNFREAEKVLEEAVNIMKSRPNESLGIATMNKHQADYIQNLIDLKRQEDSDVSNYIEKWLEKDSKVNKFFVKNLANVQGDERDIIIVSTLFGPDRESGKVRQNFGPINTKGGERRLNVLFTRAKNQLILITSLKSSDVTFDENSEQKGRQIFGEYLAYAESKDRVIQFGDVTGREVESPFQQWAIDIIESQPGFTADWEIGVKGYRIDIGVKHNDYPYSYLLAIETDGASYHSHKSARDRDKLRQEILESHGWKFYRIWSTDWLENPVQTKEKLIEAINKRLRNLKSELEKKSQKLSKCNELDERDQDIDVDFEEQNNYDDISFDKKSNKIFDIAHNSMTKKLDMITSEDKWLKMESESDIYESYGHIYNSVVITFLIKRFNEQNL